MAIFATLLFSLNVNAETKTWKVGGTNFSANGNWNVAGNWDPAGVPVAADDVVFMNVSNITVTLDFTTSTTINSISVGGGGANVVFATDANRTINLGGGGTSGTALSIVASRALTLNATVNSVGIIISIPTNYTASINGTLNLSTAGATATSQTNQLLSVDVSSVQVNSGGAINANNRNSGYPFGATAANNNIVVFNSGATFTHYSGNGPWGSTAAPTAIAQFNSGSTFNVFGSNNPFNPSLAGRTLGNLVIGCGCGTISNTANTTNFTTTIESLTNNNATIVLSATSGSASPSFALGNISIGQGSAGTAVVSLRSDVTGSHPTSFTISGNILVGGSNATPTSTLNLGPTTGTGAATTTFTLTGVGKSLDFGAAGTRTINQSNAAGSTYTVNYVVAPNASFSFNRDLSLATANTNTTLTVQPLGALTVGTGATITANGKLTVQSDATGSGRIGNSAGSISGNVIVQRYIPNTGRKWRLLTAPVTGASNNTVFTNWQNNGTVSAGTGVAIWGTGGTCDPGVTAGNGLVPGPGGGASSSMRRYNSTANAWENITNTATEELFNASTNKAFALFVTGHFGGSYATVGSGSIATTLSATGSLITGSKAFNFDYGDNAEHIAMIGNPYASPVNFFNLTRSNVNDKFWVWDPSLDGTGGYVLLTGDGSGNYTPSIVSGYSGSAAAGTVYEDIQSGQAIFVEATAAGAASVTFEEADKVSTTHVQVFRSGTQTEKLRVNLLNAANPAAIKVIDGVLVQYSNSFSNSHATEDGIKLYNDRENLWVDANGKEYMIEGRKLIDNVDTVKLTTWALQQQTYRLEIIGSNFANDANLSAFLKDKFLGTETAISLSGTTEYPFTVTADAGSKATDRFMVVFRSNASLPVTLTNVKAYQQNSGINVEWTTQSEIGMLQYEVEKSANGTNFSKVNTTAAKSGTSNNYSFFDAAPNSGANYYRIKAISFNGEVKYSSIVVVRLNTKGTKVTLYPNPVKGDNINLELTGLVKGNYNVSLFNQLGQQVLNRTISHSGTNATQTMNIGSIAAGVYELRLSNGETVVTQKLIKE
jgi:hypothetical protein